MLYWRPATASETARIPYLASNQFRDCVEVGDFVWVVTVEDGRLQLLGVVLVERIFTSRSAAEADLGIELPTEWDCFARPAGGPAPLHRIDLMADLENIRFEGSSPSLELRDGRVNAQQLQSIRTLTPRTAGLLEQRLREATGVEPTFGSSPFIVGAEYTRIDVRRVVGLLPPEDFQGAWSTGHVREAGEWFIFANVGLPGRTGHDYANEWRGDGLLAWEARGGSQLHQPSIVSMIDGSCRVHVFTRANDRAPFIYAGVGEPVETTDSSPVRVLWKFDDASPSFDPQELERRVRRLRARGVLREPPGCSLPQRRRVAERVEYERDPLVKAYVLQLAAGHCELCEEAAPFITDADEPFLELHHVRRLADGGPDTPTNAVAVCPNCHRHLHLGRDAAERVEVLYARVLRLRRTEE